MNYHQEDNVYYGKLDDIKDPVSIHSEEKRNFEKAFHKAVDDYLDFMKKNPITPLESDEDLD